MIYWLIGLTIAWVFLFGVLCFVSYRLHELKINGITNQDVDARVDITGLKLDMKAVKPCINELYKKIDRNNDKYESQFNDIHHALDKKVDKYRFYAAPPSDNIKYKVMPVTITADDIMKDLPEFNDYIGQINLTNKWEAWYKENRPKV